MRLLKKRRITIHDSELPPKFLKEWMLLGLCRDVSLVPFNGLMSHAQMKR